MTIQQTSKGREDAMKREMPRPAEGVITGFIGYLTVAIFLRQ